MIDEKSGARVILFGGGDGGGIIIGPHGVRRIPPFDPAILRQLRAVNQLCHALELRGRHAPAELASLTNRIANVAIGEVEAVVGPLDARTGLTYQDDDGGFSCGSTGRPPIPLPWPVLQGPAFDDLVSTGLLERELVEALRGGKLDVKSLLADPRAATSTAGVTLSAHALDQLEVLAKVDKLTDPVAREVATFFHTVASDGRFLETWSVRPHEVASTLGVTLSDHALDRIIAGGSTVFSPHGGGGETANIGVAVAVGIVIMLVTKDPFRIPIRDNSGLRKF